MLTHLVKLAFAQRDENALHDCSNTGNVSSNNAYRKKVNTLLSSLSSNTQIDYGFYNFSAGENSDRVNAAALCRADLTLTNCRSCVNMSAYDLLLQCPNQKEGIMWYMNCTVRYSNNSIFGVMQFEPVRHLYNIVKVTDPSGTFGQVRETLLDRLRSEAAASAWTLQKFATGNASSAYFDIYALLQCTPDLNQQECSDCLNQSIAEVPTCCGPAVGVRVLTPSCNLRYEYYHFYGSTLEAPSPSSSTLPPPAEEEYVMRRRIERKAAGEAGSKRSDMVMSDRAAKEKAEKKACKLPPPTFGHDNEILVSSGHRGNVAFSCLFSA